MATKIEWTDETWNPMRGCSRVSPGCDHCYAMREARRHDRPGGPYDGLTTIRRGRVDWSGVVRLVPEKLRDPLRWRKPRLVFVNSQSDLFHPKYEDAEIIAVFAVMAACHGHEFQVLTKRQKRMRAFCEDLYNRSDRQEVFERTLAQYGIDASCSPDWPLHNVWLGVSVEDQERAQERIPELLRTRAHIRFLSCEPLLGPLDLSPWLPDLAHREYLKGSGLPAGVDVFDRGQLHWVIAGGESGSAARPCNLAWLAKIADQCEVTKVPCFIKQLGKKPFVGEEGTKYFDHDVHRLRLRHRKGADPSEWPEGLRVRQWPEVA